MSIPLRIQLMFSFVFVAAPVLEEKRLTNGKHPLGICFILSLKRKFMNFDTEFS